MRWITTGQIKSSINTTVYSTYDVTFSIYTLANLYNILWLGYACMDSHGLVMLGERCMLAGGALVTNVILVMQNTRSQRIKL
jgi:hypothetical protein